MAVHVPVLWPVCTHTIPLETDPRILEHEDSAHEDRLNKLHQAMDLCFLEFLRDAVWLLRNALVELSTRLSCSSVISMQILAARCPEIRNPIVVHLSI